MIDVLGQKILGATVTYMCECAYRSMCMSAMLHTHEKCVFTCLQYTVSNCKSDTSMVNCSGSIEDEWKLLQRKNLSTRQKVAAKTRLSEKIVLQKTLDAVRR